MEVAEAAEWADVMMMLTPDELQADIYRDHLRPPHEAEEALMFAHGLNIHFNLIEPRVDLDVMMPPKERPRRARRDSARRRRAGADGGAQGRLRQRPRPHALVLGAAIGGGRAGIIETTVPQGIGDFDLFGEQSVLCGGLVELMKAGYETLVEAGYAPEMAYSSACTR